MVNNMKLTSRMKKLLSSFFILLKERTYVKDEYHLKYVLNRNAKSDKLIVVFSAFHPERPFYNYIRTLNKVKNANILFVLDNFGYNQKGSYYVMENGSTKLQEVVEGFIKEMQEKLDCKELICVGSSKGGTAAVIYGCRLGASAVICAAPQYYIGDYLNTKNLSSCLEGILGTITEDGIQKLNAVVKNSICGCEDRKPNVYIHYSKNEHTYVNHIKPLLEELKKNGFEMEEDVESYKNHNDVALFFPAYLLKTVSVIVSK